MCANSKCMCEHVAHLDENELTPNGNPGHQFAQRFYKGVLVQIHTTYGVIQVCPDCAKDCFGTHDHRMEPGEIFR